MVTTYHMRKELSTMVSDALHLYFQPLRYLFVLFDNSISLEHKRKALQQRLDDTTTVLKVIQKAVCFNQGAYLQYSFITAEKHKRLKEAFKKDADANYISYLAKDLMDFINKEWFFEGSCGNGWLCRMKITNN